MSVWVFMDLTMWRVASQFSFETHLELPNCSNLTPFPGVTQTVHGCRSPNETSLKIFFRCGGILLYVNCPINAWAATPNVSSAIFRVRSKKN